MIKKAVFMLMLTGMAISLAQADVPAPVLYYPMNDGSGTTVADASGNGLNGEMWANYPGSGSVVPSWTTDRNGNANSALLFGGVVPGSSWNYVYTGYDAKLDLSTNFTIATWMRTDAHSGDYSGTYGAIVSTENYTLQVGNDGDAQTYFWPNVYYDTQDPPQISAGNPAFQFGTGTEPALGAWHHLAITFDNGTFKQYIDDQLVFTKTDLPTSLTTSAELPWSWLNIGYYANSDRYFVGAMDEFRIYDSTLSQEQIGVVMNTPEPATMIMLGLGVLGLIRRK